MSDLHQPVFVNIIGHTAGAIIFGIFLFLFLRDRAQPPIGSRLSASAAGLAFLWNFGSLTELLAIQNASPASLVPDCRHVSAASAFCRRCCCIFHSTEDVG